jgi:hypothetical protein
MAQVAYAKEFRVTSAPNTLYTARDQSTAANGKHCMTRFCYSTAIRYLFVGIVVFASTSWAQTRPPILEELAKTYGLDSWEQIEAIRYTWNAEIPGLFKVSHVWEWEPKANKIIYEGKDKNGKPVKVTYIASAMSSQSDLVRNEVEPSFVNDNYWLLFPFHAYWDTSASVTDEGVHKLPMGNGSAKKVVVKYPTEAGGYTPGDTWDLYLGKDNRVEYFVYHRGGSTKPTLVIASWAGYKKAGPLLISTEHRGTADGKPLHIFISDVAVKLRGSDSWINAK